jgi:glycosyltransferase involved in cell wall biosynthesis
MINKTSVVICVYNYPRFLPRCLESAHSQSRPAEELILGDIGSTESLPLKICYSAKGLIRDKHTSKLL